MRTFLISYDLANPSRNKHALATAIMSLGTSWARPLEHTWYLRADVAEIDVEARLAPLLDDEDGLIVQAVVEDGAFTNTQLRWFRQRRPAFDLDAHTNVVVFPSTASVSAAQPELPLAAAG